MRVLILRERLPAGARADEADAKVQAEAVRGALERLGHLVEELETDLDLATTARSLRERAPDAVFNLVEALERTGRLIHLAPAVIEALGVPLCGSSALALELTSCKPLTKRRLEEAGVPTPDWRTLPQLRAGVSVPAGRWVLKSSWEHGSLGLEEDGVVECADAGRLAASLERALPRLGGEGFAERWVEGRELNISLLAGPDGPEVLPHAEIAFTGDWGDRPRLVGWRAKWDPTSFEWSHTPRRFHFPASDAPLLAELSALSRRCWELLGVGGWARVDFRVDSTGQPFVLEVNANPCLSPDAGFAAAVERAGLSFDRAIERIVAAGLAASPRPSPPPSGSPPEPAARTR